MTYTPGTRVIVVADPYGTHLGRHGTVVDTPPQMAAVTAVDLAGTVWVALDDAMPGPTPAPGFAPEELAPEGTQLPL